MRWKAGGDPLRRASNVSESSWTVAGRQAVGSHEKFLSRAKQRLVAGNRTDYKWEISLPGQLRLRLLVLCRRQKVRRTRHAAPEGSQVPTACIPELTGPHHSQAWNLSTILKRGPGRLSGGKWEDGEGIFDSAGPV